MSDATDRVLTRTTKVSFALEDRWPDLVVAALGYVWKG
jgi:hypothetical protein